MKKYVFYYWVLCESQSFENARFYGVWAVDVEAAERALRVDVPNVTSVGLVW